MLVDMAVGIPAPISVTLYVGGAVIGGEIIGGEEYFRLFLRAQAVPGQADKMESIGMEHFEVATRKAAIEGVIGEGDTESTHHEPMIFLKEIRVLDGGRIIPTEGVLWSGFLTAVDGFSVGRMAPGR